MHRFAQLGVLRSFLVGQMGAVMATQSSSIHKLHWGQVPHLLAGSWRHIDGTLLAIWPAPNNADECLRLAGFTDFADSDDAWDAEWRGIIERAVDWLARYGTARMRQRIEVHQVQARSLFERLFRTKPPTKLVDLSIVDQLILLTEDDAFPAAVVDFGEPSAVSLRTCYGHVVLWVATSQSVCLDLDTFLTTLAGGRRIERTDLDWTFLVDHRELRHN